MFILSSIQWYSLGELYPGGYKGCHHKLVPQISFKELSLNLVSIYKHLIERMQKFTIISNFCIFLFSTYGDIGSFCICFVQRNSCTDVAEFCWFWLNNFTCSTFLAMHAWSNCLKLGPSKKERRQEEPSPLILVCFCTWKNYKLSWKIC